MLIKPLVFSSFFPVCMPRCMCRGQRTSYGSQFSAPPVWVLRVELMSLALQHTAIPAQSACWPPEFVFVSIRTLHFLGIMVSHFSIYKLFNAKYYNPLNHLVLAKPLLGINVHFVGQGCDSVGVVLT